MPTIPRDIESVATDVATTICNVEGFMKPCELQFLTVLAACPTAHGEILEIGSYFGKSTIALAKGAALTDNKKVIAVDPLPSDAWPAKLAANLQNAGVSDSVEFHQMTSQQLGKTWDQPLRLLWIDGDHSYANKTLDFDTFAPYLADGAIVAFHDVLHRFEGPVRTFIERVLLSDHFGAVGLCGSIGWGQYLADATRCEPHKSRKLRLYRRLSRLVPSVAFNNQPIGIRKVQHEFFRALIPSHGSNAAVWAKMVA